MFLSQSVGIHVIPFSWLFCISPSSRAPGPQHPVAGTRCLWKCRCSASGRRSVRASSKPSASTVPCLGECSHHTALANFPWPLHLPHGGQGGAQQWWVAAWLRGHLTMWQETRKKDGSGDANIITQKLPTGKRVHGGWDRGLVLGADYSISSAASPVAMDKRASLSENGKITLCLFSS